MRKTSSLLVLVGITGLGMKAETQSGIRPHCGCHSPKCCCSPAPGPQVSPHSVSVTNTCLRARLFPSRLHSCHCLKRPILSSQGPLSLGLAQQLPTSKPYASLFPSAWEPQATLGLGSVRHLMGVPLQYKEWEESSLRF